MNRILSNVLMILMRSLTMSYGRQACACFGSCLLRSSQDKQPSEPSSGPQFVKGNVNVGRPVSGLI